MPNPSKFRRHTTRNQINQTISGKSETGDGADTVRVARAAAAESKPKSVYRSTSTGFIAVACLLSIGAVCGAGRAVASRSPPSPSKAVGTKITLTYRCRPNGAEWQDIAETVRLEWLLCRYGGQRPYFRCPGVVNGKACNRRVAMLYCASRYYVCRHCNRLTYAVRSEDRFDRALRRANNARVKLGGKGGAAQPLAIRPRGMWWRTYERTTRTIFEAEQIADERLALAVARIRAADIAAPAAPNRKQKKGFWT